MLWEAPQESLAGTAGISRSVRRAAAGAVPDRRSAKVCRKQVGLRQRNRRAWTCNVTGRPCQGRSNSRRRYRLWRRSDATPHSGHDAEVWRELVTMAMWSGFGMTWSTMRPAGIKGSRCLDKRGFQEKTESSYVLIQPRTTAREVRENLNADQHRAARDDAFRTWREVAGVASAA